MDTLTLFSSFAIIALAELGDKTQLLAMALSLRYKRRDVLISVFAASALLMLFAIFVGRTLYTLIPASLVQLITGTLFLFFGIWIFFSEDENENLSSSKTPFLSVFSAFIFTEIGDKTQLAAIALAIKYNATFEVWAGATAGMVVANSVGIFAGDKMRMHLSQKLIKSIAAGLFFLFGTVTIYAAL